MTAVHLPPMAHREIAEQVTTANLVALHGSWRIVLGNGIGEKPFKPLPYNRRIGEKPFKPLPFTQRGIVLGL